MMLRNLFFILLIATLPIFIFGEVPSKEKVKKDCLDKKPSACALLGYHIKSEKEIKDFLTNACNKNIPNACTMLGAEIEKNNIESAKKYYEKGCKLGDGTGCITSGQIYMKGTGNTVKDSEKGKEFINIGIPLLKKECEQNTYFSCYIIYMIEDNPKMFKNVQRLKLPIEKIIEYCNDDIHDVNGGMCDLAAEYLQKNIMPNLPTPTSLRMKSYAQREEICEKTGSGCYTLGKELRDGKHGIKDEDKALKLMLKSCDSKYGEACNSAGVMCDQKEEDKKARDLFKKACDLKDALGCSNSGIMWENGDGGLVDYNEAMKYYLKAAELGNDEATEKLADLLKKLVDADTADMGFGIFYYGNTQKIDTRVEAYMWYNIASALGIENAATKRDEMKSTMNSRQILEAQQKSNKWMETHRNKEGE